MQKLIEALGLDPKILIAQVINFVILMFLLYKLGYKHILKFVEDRTRTIENGLKNAEKATQGLASAQKEQEKLIAEAQAQGRDIVTEAKANAEKVAADLIAKNTAQIDALNVKHAADMSALREQMLGEVRAEASTLIFSVVEKVLREKMTEEADKKLVQKLLAETQK